MKKTNLYWSHLSHQRQLCRLRNILYAGSTTILVCVCVCVRAALFQAQLLSVFKQCPSESTVYSKWVISLNMLQQTKRPRHAPPFRQNIAVSRRMQASRGSLGNLWIQGNAAASRKQCIEVSQRMLANMVVFYGYETERHGKPSNTIKQWRYVLHHIICF